MPLKYYHPEFLRKAVGQLSKQSPDWNLVIVVEKQDFAKFTKLSKEELHDRRIDIILIKGQNSLVRSYRHEACQTDFVAILLADDMWSTTQ